MANEIWRRGRCRIGLFLFTGLFLATVLVTPPGLRAQSSSTGALTGRLTDSSGAAVPNATVTLTSADTAQARTTMTEADGTYKFGLLPPGKYQLRIEASGFKAVDIPNLTVSVTETAVLDRALEVGSQTQTITVNGSVEVVQTTSSALGNVAAGDTVTALPLNTRNYTNLLSMAAGANSNVENASTVGKGSVFIAVNGAGFGQNTYLQDGVSVDSWFSFNTGTEGKSNGSFAIPIPDAIAEFKIQTSSYDAGYGRNPGANVNVVTKSGTNSLHGTGFEFFRNTALNANSWFNNFFGQPKGVLNSNQYGGAVGGPIKKDKLFFFVSYQETNQKNGITGFGETTPTLPPIPQGNRGSCPPGWTALSQCNAAGQAFVGNLAAAMCPANHPSDATKYQTNKDAGVQVACTLSPSAPLGNLNPVAISILQLQLPNGGGYLVPGSGASDYATTTLTSPAIFKDYNGMGNWDYVINGKNTLSGRYQYEKDPQFSGIASQDANTAVGVFLPGEPGEETHINHSAILKLTSILSPTKVNQVNVAYERLISQNSELTPFTNSQVGIKDLQPGLDQLSYITTPNFSLGAFYQYGTNNPVNQFQGNDQLSWERGKHSFRVGFGAEHILAKTYFPGHAAGNLAFSSVADFLIGRASCQAFTGTGTCSVANPGNTNGTAASNDTLGAFGAVNSTFSGYFSVNELNAFVQDDFKVTQRFTLNVGVRWEYDGNVTAKNGLESSLWTSLLNNVPLPGNSPQTGTLAGFVVPNNYTGPAEPGLFVNSNNGLTDPPAPKGDFAPRVGIAWQPTQSARWVIRSGAGLFYDVLPGNTILNMLEVSAPALVPPVTTPTLSSLANPFQEQTPIYPGPAGTAGFVTRWIDTSVPIPVTCPAPSLANPCSSNLSQAAIPQNFKVPITYEWNLNTQYEFIKNWVLELAYVGSHGIDQAPQSRSGLQGQASAQAGYNIAQLVGANCTSCALTGVTTNTPANAPLRVPYLGVAATDTALLTNASYKYNSAQVTVRRQLSHGLQLQAAYTFARGFITEPFGYNTYPYTVESYEPNNNYHPHRFVANYVWNVPFPEYKGFKGQLLDGWSWTGVTTIQDGVPLTILDTGASIFYGGTGSSTLSTGQLCPGMTYANLLTTGNLTDRVASGLLGGPGYLNGHSQGVLCSPPTIGATPGVAGTGGTGFGNIGGGAVLGPGQNNWDMAVAKQFAIREGQSLMFRAEFFNTFNHAQFQIPNLSANQATFGQITALVVSPRIIQLALKYSF